MVHKKTKQIIKHDAFVLTDGIATLPSKDQAFIRKRVSKETWAKIQPRTDELAGSDSVSSLDGEEIGVEVRR